MLLLKYKYYIRKIGGERKYNERKLKKMEKIERFKNKLIRIK